MTCNATSNKVRFSCLKIIDITFVLKGIIMRYRIDEKTISRMVSLYLGGVSEKRIAETFGYSRSVIRRILLERKVRIRTQSECEKLRWSQMTQQERNNQIKAAHKACKGLSKSWLSKCRHAQTIEKKPSNYSNTELILQEMLAKRGIETIHQKAIGAYNCDLAAHPVGVEIWGGRWHLYGKHARILEERLTYLLRSGWFIYIIPITKSFPLTESVADYVAAYINLIRRNKPIVSEYRVVWGHNNFSVCGSLDSMNLPIIPPFTGRRNPTSGRYERIPR